MNRAIAYDQKIHCITDLELAANEKLTPMVCDFYSGGSMELKTFAENKSSYDRYRLRPRVMMDVTSVDTSQVVLVPK